MTPSRVATKQEAMSVNQQPIVQQLHEHNRTRALARLRQATWEATQYLSYDEVEDYVDAVLCEVESDEP